MRPSRRAGLVAALGAVTVLLAACTGGDAPAGRSAASRPPAPTSAVVSGDPVSPSAPASSSAPAAVVYRSGLAVPDPAATPGASLPGVTRAQVCEKSWNARHNKIGYTVQNEVSVRYGVVAGPGTSLHLDQLVPASLGGTATLPNVWPQPQAQLKRKNALEAHLHQLVCAGSLPLATAQRAVAADWPAAARRYPPT